MARGQRRVSARTDDIETQQIGATIPALGENAHITRDDIEVVQPAQMASRAEQEKFMNEFVVINIQPDDDPNAPEFIQCGHQGITQYIHRGRDQRIRRKFLYALVAGKKTQFACAFGKDNSGNEFNRMAPSSRTTYRLDVVEDTPAGRKAFAQWMREP